MHLTKFSRKYFDPSNPNILEKNPRKKRPVTAIKYFGKKIFPHFLVAIADLTHPPSNYRSSVRIIGCYLTKFLRKYFDPSNPNKFFLNFLVRNGLTAIKCFGKQIFPHFLVAVTDLTHPLSNNRSSIRIIGCYKRRLLGRRWMWK